jgi:glucose/arabinose dehydrogenase
MGYKARRSTYGNRNMQGLTVQPGDWLFVAEYSPGVGDGWYLEP